MYPTYNHETQIRVSTYPNQNPEYEGQRVRRHREFANLYMGFPNSGILNPGFSGKVRVTKSEYKLFISGMEYCNSGIYS